MEQPACYLNINNPHAIGDLWCVYGHHMKFDLTKPPNLVYVAACKLEDIFAMREARNNSEWMKLIAYNPPIQIQVIETFDNKTDAFNFMDRYIRTLPQFPRCNLHGYNMFRANREIMCQDGRRFANQAAAARALGCSQAAISQHLSGKIPSVKGLTLSYVKSAQ